MSLNKTLDRLFDEIRREAKRNPEFADRLDAVLRLHDSRRDVGDDVIEAVAREAHEQPRLDKVLAQEGQGRSTEQRPPHGPRRRCSIRSASTNARARRRFQQRLPARNCRRCALWWPSTISIRAAKPKRSTGKRWPPMSSRKPSAAPSATTRCSTTRNWGIEGSRGRVPTQSLFPNPQSPL